MKKNEVAELIKNTLNVKSDKPEVEELNEALVAQTKTYSLPTEALSQANKKNHYELYEQYVKDFNRISAELDSVSRSDASSNHSLFRSLKIDETFNLNAVYLHELYFSNIGDLQSEITMDTLSFMRLERDFGSFDQWQMDFLACATASRCGWVVTGYNIFTQTYMNYVVDLHSLQVPVGVIPVVVMDVWQHAYYKDYLKNVSEYTQNMMRELNWTVIESRFKRAEKAALALK
jgi:superoxide dismutase, Fe-Mn family